MHKLQFAIPVRIVRAPGGSIEEIYGVEHALDFLQELPAGRQGPLFQAAFDACFGASVDIVATEEACRSFSAFCRVSEILAPDMVVPSEPRAKARRLPVLPGSAGR